MNGRYIVRQGKLKDGSYGRAIFSACERFRFQLERAWSVGDDVPPRLATWIMLNPSTATELKNDPTITRCCIYSQAWGMTGLFITNLYPLRSTDPRALKAYDGAANVHADAWIRDACDNSDLVVCAWGNHGTRERAAEVLAIVASCGMTPHALRVTGTGMPSHPLYLPKDLNPQPYKPEWI